MSGICALGFGACVMENPFLVVSAARLDSRIAS
jgi:hypothetical protein